MTDNLFDVYESRRQESAQAVTPSTSLREKLRTLSFKTGDTLLGFLSRAHRDACYDMYDKCFGTALSDAPSTCRPTHVLRDALVLAHLNIEQRDALVRCVCACSHAMRENAGRLFVLDARPGTGKTTFVVALSMLLAKVANDNNNLLYVVYSNKLRRNMDNYGTVHAMTLCKFMMFVTRLSYTSTIHMWRDGDCRDDVQAALDAVRARVANVAPEVVEKLRSYTCIVLDEYTVPNPWQLVFFRDLARRFRLRVVLVGDRNQQSSVSRTRFHCANNWPIARALTASDDRYTFGNVVRQASDPVFSDKLKAVLDYIGAMGMTGTVRVPFDLMLFLYRSFTDNFETTEENFARHLFLAQHHATLKARTARACAYAQSTGARVVYSDYSASLAAARSPSTAPPRAQNVGPGARLLDAIPLVAGWTYFYDDGFCTLETLSEDDKEIHVRRIHDGTSVTLKRTRLNQSSVLPSVYKDVIGSSVCNIDIHPLVSTYCAIQGCTLNASWEVGVDMDLDASIENVLVGLTRVETERQLGRLSTAWLPHVRATVRRNDEFFYLVGAGGDDGGDDDVRTVDPLTFDAKSAKGTNDVSCRVSGADYMTMMRAKYRDVESVLERALLAQAHGDA